jgi:hypothetical protein
VEEITGLNFNRWRAVLCIQAGEDRALVCCWRPKKGDGMGVLGTVARNTALSTLESKLPKVISPKAHSVIDYAHAAFFFTTGVVLWKKNRRAAIASLGTGAFVLVEAMLTDYPGGVSPQFSFKTHGRMDAGFASASLIVPNLLAFDQTSEAQIFRVNSVVEACVVGLTNYDSREARRERMAA